MGTYSELVKTSLPSGRKKRARAKAHKQPRNRDTTKPRHHDTMTPRYHDTIIESVRSTVKDFGKEAATHRFTLEEKKAIAAIIFAYKNRGIQTSENEITRVAINYIERDYKQNGENSILHKVLEALNR